MIRLLFLSTLLSASAVAQTISDVLPRGMILDRVGKLQWADFEPSPCEQCKGGKLVACQRCEDLPKGVDCAFCSARKVPCSACGATGQTRDPYLEVACFECRGLQREPCPTCAGERLLVTPKGRERACGGCRGRGAFKCPMCAGTGRLPMVRVEGKDPRRATSEGIEAVRARLAGFAATLEDPSPASEDASARLRAYAEFLSEIGQTIPLPEGQQARLKAIVQAAKADKDDEFSASFALGTHERALVQYVGAQLEVLDLCLWRLRRNAGEIGNTEPRKRASAIRWSRWFGEDPAKPSNMYCLLGRGFFRSPSAENTERVIKDWMAKHPAATVQPVARLEGSIRRAPDSQLIYAWIVDGKANLNLHLVERGCVMGGTMASPSPRIEVPFADYAGFLRKVRAAEKDARRAKRGYWGAAKVAQQDHEAKAKRLMKDGDYAEALPELRAAIGASGGSEYLWLDVGECHEKLEQWEQALAAYDKAIGDGRRWPPYMRKAHCIRQSRGLDAAVEWLEELAAKTPKDRKFPHILGVFLWESGEVEKAIPHYKVAVKLASAKHNFRFDDQGWLILDESTLAKENNDYADLWPTLEYLSQSLFETGATADAMKYATMGVAIGQQLKRCKGYYSETEVEAGDVECRLVRARVLVKQKQWVEAEKDVRLARALARRSGYTGWMDAIAKLERVLEARRK